MKKISLLLTTWHCTILSILSQYPVVKYSRPRILADSARVAWMQAQANVPGPYQTDFNTLVYNYNNYWITDPQLYMSGGNPQLWTWNWGSIYARTQALFTVFIYKIKGDSLQLERCKFLAQNLMDTVASANWQAMGFYQKEYFLRLMSEVGCWILDWCYQQIPPALRYQLVQTLFNITNLFMTEYVLNSNGESYVSSHNTLNCILNMQNVLTLYHAPELTASQQSTVASWYQTLYDKFINGFIPCWSHFRENAGGWNWGSAYSMWGFVDQFELFENLRIATNKNFFAELPWLQNSINQYLYYMRPDNKCIHLGDGEFRMTNLDIVMCLHARYFNDPRSLWLAQYWSQPSMISWSWPLFQKLLYKDYNAPLISQPNFPTHWYSEKVGLSVSRSSWQSDATLVTFYCAPVKRAAHEHRDNNSFTVFKHKPLLLDAGFYDNYNTSHFKNYYTRTIAHNSICVFDSTESYFIYGGQPVSNDGGQIESIALMNINDILNPANKRGEWILYGAGSDYQYNVADAHQSYNPSKLDFFRRKLLHHKPDNILVVDYVHLKNITTAQRDIQWLGHFVNEPQMSGNVLSVQVPNHIVKYNGKDYTATNGNGAVAIRTVFPLHSNVTKVGGPGYEYWVNGTNYVTTYAPDLNEFSPGSWRIEVRPDSLPSDGKVVFLHTLKTGSVAAPPTPGGMPLRSAYSLGVDWENVIYFFSSDGHIHKNYHVFTGVQGGRTVEIFAADLEEGLYNVLLNGNVYAAWMTDSVGILRGTVTLPSGFHKVEIIKVNQEIPFVSDGAQKNSRFRIYPNPSYDRVIIDATCYAGPTRVCLFGSDGKLLECHTNPSALDMEKYRPGVYYLTFETKEERTVLPLIKH